MDDTFKIFVHRLKDGHEEKIEERLDPHFLDIKEAELSCDDPINLKGVAQLADDLFILRMTIETQVIMPCAICNQDVHVKIFIPNLYHTESLENIKSGVFDYREVLREAILLEVPYIAECNSGDCPERASMAKYLHNDQKG